MCSVEISEQLVVTLTVVESTMEDAGEYAVRVYNEYGEVTSTTQVNVLFEAPVFTAPPTDQQVRDPVNLLLLLLLLLLPLPLPYWLASFVA